MNLALFDFDGTITTRDTLPEFMHAAVAPMRLATGKLMLAPLIAGYRIGIVPATVVRSSIVQFGFRGVAQEKIQRAGQAFARDALPGVLRPMAMDRIRWHQQQGDTVVVVSGGFDFYLSHWCRQHGLGLICSALEARAGVLTGRYRGRQCVGREKPRRILEQYHLRDYHAVYGYGDTHEDLDMLGIASRKYFRWKQIA